jgi:cytochrome c-type biogenesis protein CcmH
VTRRATTWIRLAITAALAVFVAVSVFTAPAPAEDRAQAIGSLIKCPVCAGEAIANSPSSLARDMMTLVREGVDAGLTDDQIIDSVVGAYGADAQVLDPRIDASTIALILVPALVLVGGAGLIFSRRRTEVSRSPLKTSGGDEL